MMQYNMMYYTTSAPANCNTSGNYMNEKDANLKTIIDYVLPDVFCVCEIGSQTTYVNRVLNNVMNSNGRNYYANCPLTNYSGGYSTIANMLYYDSRKLEFHSHFYVTTSVRDINAYKMYYKSNSLAQGDTAFITFIIAHLKAGTYDSDKNTRKTQVERLTTKLEQMGIDNYVFSGDFNLYNASEPAYQHLLFNNNTAFRFLDPIDAYGEWHRNQQFAKIHTQSTHTTNENGCFATGGLDDRFDFILVSPTLFYGTRKVKVMPETYHAMGQDGLRLRGNLLSPTNNTLPKDILQAMYNFSDHLPVICNFEIKTATKIEEYTPTFYVNVENPIKNEINLQVFAEKDQLYNFEIYTINGQRLENFSEYISAGNNNLSRRFHFAPSLYFIRITNEHKETIVKKLIKVK
jgi:exonuclease III